MDKRLVSAIILALAFTSLTVRCGAQEKGLGVPEANSRVVVGQHDVTLKLAVVPREMEEALAVEVRLLSPDGRETARTDTAVTVRPRDRWVTAVVPGVFKTKDGEEDSASVPWYRLGYELRRTNGEVLASGILPLFAIDRDIFDVAISAGTIAEPGRTYTVRASTRSESQAPVAGVQLRAELSYDSDDDEAEQADKKLVAQVTSDARGEAVLRFAIPSDLRVGDGDLSVEGTKGPLVRSVTQEVRIGGYDTILLETDKPIYQPGQTLHARGLVFSSKREAVKDQPLELSITDPRGTVVHKEDLKSDAFGVVHADWAIPASGSTGEYSLRLQAPGDYRTEAWRQVQVYRYELPSFTVTAEPDRPYYLKGQNAVVKVHAVYLFGKPVARGQVKVVQEEDRHWDFEKRAWVAEKGEERTGELDANGEFSAEFGLAGYFDALGDSEYSRYRDADFTAYVTDGSTGRTEQRRFTIRVTREPIHVYISASHTQFFPGFPGDLFVSAFYADGKPARCTVTLAQAKNDDDKQENGTLVATVHTNKYGIARVRGIRFSKLADDNSFRLIARASDRKGLSGHTADDLWFYGEQAIRVSTQRAIYRPGEPLDVVVQATRPELRVVVDVVRDGEVLQSRTVQLRKGQGFVVFPYDRRMTDDVTIAAYSFEHFDPDNRFPAARVVLFPRKHNLRVRVKLDRQEYRPGEEATANISVDSADGVGIPSVIGLKIVDQAVEERARTDMDFRGSGRWWRWSLWYDSSASFGAVTREDLNQIDLGAPIPQDLDEVADYIINSYPQVPRLSTADPIEDPARAFKGFFETEFKEVEAELKVRGGTVRYPRNVADVEAVVSSAMPGRGPRDPWGSGYRYAVRYERQFEFVTATSPGPDKTFGTSDDFVAREWRSEYFAPVGRAIEAAGNEFLAGEGRFIRDFDTLRALLRRKGIDLDQLRDPWGNPYKFEFSVNRSVFQIEVTTTAGLPADIPDQKRTTVWRGGMNYFAKAREHIDTILSQRLRSGGAFPATAEEFRKILAASGVNLDQMTDPFGSPYYISLETHVQYGDRVTISQQDTAGTRVSTPVTLVRREVAINSAGLDRTVGTKDDFQVASFSALVSEQTGTEALSKPAEHPVVVTGQSGAIAGVVTDPMGAVITNAHVTAAQQGKERLYEATPGSDGRFELRNLPPGTYLVTAVAPGFRQLTFDAVPVSATIVTELKLGLSIGEMYETVEVQASAEVLETTSSSFSAAGGVIGGIAAPPPPPPPGGGIATPRVRGDFPETLLWQPELLTTRGGHARLRFRMADNITTWKLTGVASTRTGELGRVEQDIRVFQPFFIEHEPPKVLTVGDEIAYPVVIRNYLDRAQTVRASIAPADWFRTVGASAQEITVPPGEAGTAVFRYRAVAATAAGMQRVEATNEKIGDAAQKPIEVHPDGRQDFLTASDLIGDRGTLSVNVPTQVMSGTVRAQVTIYPSLLAHVTEGMEALLERPNGCGEQVISSSYPSLLLLMAAERGAAASRQTQEKAKRYLEAGYERLLEYRRGGGFTYWGDSEPDLALTAYAYQFLSQATAYVDVDDQLLEGTETWLLKQQQPDGSWAKGDDKLRNLQMTAYLARVLAEAPRKMTAIRSASLHKALQYLAANRALILSPYTVASAALAAQAAGDQAGAQSWREWLRSHTQQDGSQTYWELQENTPFYAWGRPGRVEATAIALRALVGDTGHPSSVTDRPLMAKATLFLFRSKDQYGTWYSGQTTVAVMQALLAMGGEQRAGSAGTVTMSINGKPAGTLATDAGGGPITVDVSDKVGVGGNHIKFQSDGGATLTAQAVISYYAPWNTPLPEGSAAPALRLSVNYSRTDGTTADPVTCHVRAERVGFRGHGMMLAEIGLPPGAEIDRKSLEDVLGGQWSVYRYDVMPDRVVLYLWPAAGGTEFSFKFRPRFAMDAQTAPSVLYDYYNPEAQTVVAPTTFHVRSTEDLNR